MTKAKEKSISLCMHRLGFEYKISKQTESFQPSTPTELRYGITNISDAAKYGYKPKDSGIVASEPPPTVKPEPKGYALALTGDAKSAHHFNGEALPKDGCIGESRRALRDTVKDGGGGDAEISNAINASSWQNSYQDIRVRTAFREWSQCMRRQGYKYTDPMQANNDPRWRVNKPVTMTEKRVAATDAACKKTHNVVGVWYATDVSYQEKMIANNRGKLDPVKKKIEMQLHLSAKILGQ
ncbi:hypothetical protein ACFYXJ_27360 [Streptomyces sp. NPDC002667]|uniref:hypothetical protein n=1 Tax=Streptomyces sp. NPDC002667 TaxID=3364657 RepID=UPI0036BB9012